MIEVRLADSNEVVDVMRKFQSGSALSVADAPEGRILFGSWDGEDVVVVKTGDHSWEIHCHGGAVAISRICHDLEAAGISYGKQLHLTDESLAQRITRITNSTLMKCRTRKVAGLVLAQQDGRLLRLAEDLQSGCGDNRHKAEEHLRRWQSVAKHLTRPWRVAIVGEPNVGKSSLINAMAGLQRSIVSAVPGTTRDQVEVDIVIRGWMFRLIDTAGVRGEADSLPEQLGIVQSLALIEDCDLICLVIEATSPGFESALVERLKNVCTPICIVRNKCDLPRDSEETGNSMFAMNLDYVDAIAGTINVSAKTGLGISELLDWIAETAIPEEPGPETALPLVELFGTV